MNLKNKLNRFTASIKTFWWMANIYYSSKKRGLNTLSLLLEQNHSIDKHPERIKDRIERYIVLNRMMMESFARLHDRKLVQAELDLSLLIAAFTPVYDDLMDDYGYSHEQLYALLDSDLYIQHGSLEALYVRIYNQIRARHPNFDWFKTYYDRSGKAQDLSITKQRSEKTSKKELREITYDKGGNFCLLYRTGMNVKISESEEKAIFQIGGLTQYVNDLFDLYDDEKQNCFTLPMKLDSVQEIKDDYYRYLEYGYDALLEMAVPNDAKNHCWILQYALLSRGLVALEHYQKIEDQLGQFNVAALSRKRIIVDMEKLPRLMKNFGYVMNWPFR